MGREVRRVPKDWKHPKDKFGQYIPLWEHYHWLVRIWQKDSGGYPMPSPNEAMPSWRKNERTHYQYYEDTTPGTPRSPIFKSMEELNQWLKENGEI